jgi:prostaglandin-H2 D-isomerase / glutathione transferase
VSSKIKIYLVNLIYKMKLTYFNVRGFAETSRILLAITGQDYEDFRYPLNIIDLATFNMEKTEFDSAKKDGKLLDSLNKVPFLEVDGTIIPQSKAIERYIASQGNMMGDSSLEYARIDSICECIRDFKDVYQRVRKSENKEEEMTKWFTETLPEKLGLLEHIIGRENDSFSVGNRLSLADVVIFTFITQFFDDKTRAMDSTNNTTNIRNIVNNVSTNEKVINWLNNRPDTLM